MCTALASAPTRFFFANPSPLAFEFAAELWVVKQSQLNQLQFSNLSKSQQFSNSGNGAPPLQQGYVSINLYLENMESQSLLA